MAAGGSGAGSSLCQRDFLTLGGLFGSGTFSKERMSALAQAALGSVSMSSPLMSSVIGIARIAPRPPSSQAQNHQRDERQGRRQSDGIADEPGLDDRLDHRFSTQ